MAVYAEVRAIRCHLPAQSLTNEELIREFPEWDVEKIYSKTGIKERRIAGTDEFSSDLGIAAARKLFEEGVIQPEEIDFLLFCTQSPDYYLPTTACLVQDRLGLPTHCGALDFNLGCSGYVYGLSLAKGLIETGAARNVLLITAETYSKFIHPKDKSVRTLFGDGAAATLIGASEGGERIGPFVFGTDGSGSNNLIVPAGCMRIPCSSESAEEKRDDSGNVRSDDHLYMNGPEIFNFTLESVPKLCREILEKADTTFEEIDYIVFHQANRFMLEALRKRLKIPPEKFIVNMDVYGNTVSSTIPMALELGYNRGCLRPDSRVLLVGFGVGYSWAATLIHANFNVSPCNFISAGKEDVDG
jgi:3-oxoacyl-[acyl-carrier-protein] synthase III